jgi:hypothetical protein
MLSGGVQDIIPLDNRYLELLHLELNVCNAAIGLTRDTFHYLLTEDGQPRDRSEFPPEACAQQHPPLKAFRPSQEYLSARFYLDSCFVQVFGPSLVRPLTGYRGAQCSVLFKRGGPERLWTCNLLQDGLNKLLADPSVKHIVSSIKAMWGAIGVLLFEARRPVSNVPRLKLAVANFSKELATFSAPTMLSPCRYRWRLYDHVVAQHLVPQVERLLLGRLSLAQMSSCRLEASNKVVKRMWRRRPGGGVAQALNTHMPLQQVLRAFDLKCRVGRLAIYNQYKQATSVDDPD